MKNDQYSELQLEPDDWQAAQQIDEGRCSRNLRVSIVIFTRKELS